MASRALRLNSRGCLREARLSSDILICFAGFSKSGLLDLIVESGGRDRLPSHDRIVLLKNSGGCKINEASSSHVKVLK